jgi:hypothetical protein
MDAVTGVACVAKYVPLLTWIMVVIVVSCGIVACLASRIAIIYRAKPGVAYPLIWWREESG